MTGKRYSVRILGKYLVIIANPAQYLTHAPFPVPLPFHRLCSETTPIIMSVRKDLTGGHFSA
jgi:hypothetical protein